MYKYNTYKEKIKIFRRTAEVAEKFSCYDQLLSHRGLDVQTSNGTHI
jgi:hypothetical protein